MVTIVPFSEDGKGKDGAAAGVLASAVPKSETTDPGALAAALKLAALTVTPGEGGTVVAAVTTLPACAAFNAVTSIPTSVPSMAALCRKLLASRPYCPAAGFTKPTSAMV